MDIIFRAKPKNDGANTSSSKGKWIYGYINQPYQNVWEIYPPDYGRWCEVEEDTICEYTLCKDKNGIRIFDGDIIEIDGMGMQGCFVIEHSEGGYWVTDGMFVNELLLDVVNYEPVVVGNIYDNPELVERDR